jgi:phage gp29-like protein
MELNFSITGSKSKKDTAKTVKFADTDQNIKNYGKTEMLGIHASSELWTRLLDVVPNPDKVLQNKESTINDLYNPLLIDAHVSSCVQSRKSAVLSMEWGIDIGKKETPETEFIKKIFYGDKELFLEGYNIPRQIDEMLDASAYGFKPMEVLWRYVGEYLVATDIAGRPQDWFGFDPFGLLKFKGEYGLGTSELMLRKKFLIIRQNSTSQNPYGSGYLSKCYWPATFKKGGFMFWTKFAEKYGAPFLWAKLGQSANQDDAIKLKTAMTSLINGGVLVLDTDTEGINHIQAGSASSADIYKNLIHFLNAEISKAILSQTLTTEQGDTGSYSMSKTHLEVMQNVVDADKRMIEFYYNQLIKWIIDFNFASPEHYPAFSLEYKEDINEMLERDIKILQSGQVRFTDQRWRKYLDEGDYELTDPSNKPPAFQIYNPGNELQFAENVLDQLMEEDFNKAMEKIMEPVLKMVQKGKSYEEIEKKIKKYLPDLDTNQLQEVMESINFIKSIEGYEGAK